MKINILRQVFTKYQIELSRDILGFSKMVIKTCLFFKGYCFGEVSYQYSRMNLFWNLFHIRHWKYVGLSLKSVKSGVKIMELSRWLQYSVISSLIVGAMETDVHAHCRVARKPQRLLSADDFWGKVGGGSREWVRSRSDICKCVKAGGKRQRITCTVRWREQKSEMRPKYC